MARATTAAPRSRCGEQRGFDHDDDVRPLADRERALVAVTGEGSDESIVGGARYGTLTGARVQRPLWASTGVKNPEYSDTLYVTELVAPNTVNTMPEKTLDAVADHGAITGDTVTGKAGEAQAVFDKLSAAGIDLPDVFRVLEEEGVEKFEKSWLELLDATQEQLDAAKK